MDRVVEIGVPFFEVGPKAYMFGSDALHVAMHADAAGLKYDVQVIVDPQYVDIPRIAPYMKRALVFAQHMDPVVQGRGQGSVLAEALKAAGAAGAILNHVERRQSTEELARAVGRAEAAGLASMVCTDDLEQAVAAAALEPTIIVVESPDLIGSGGGTAAGDRRAAIAECNRAIWKINPGIRVLHGAAIGGAEDVYKVIAAGAQGTGSSSAIFTATDPAAMVESMVKAVREAWDATH